VGHLRDLFVHKALVFREGRKLGVPLGQLLAHDLSKLSRGEYIPSVRFKYAPQPLSAEDEAACDAGRELHWRRNGHHPEHWLGSGAGGQPRPIEMPDRFRREMLADWRAVGRMKRLRTRPWYEGSFDASILHPATRAWIEQEIDRGGW
jgi:hypothetical protein